MWQVLALGFTLILSLWLVTSVQVTRRMTQVQDEATNLNTRYVRAQDAVSALRGHVLLSSAYVRDALLDPRDAATAEYHRKVNAVLVELRRTVVGYETFLPGSQEAVRLAALSLDLAVFETEMTRALERDIAALLAADRLALGQQVVSARDRAVRTSESFQAGNRTDYVHAQTAIANQLHDAQNRMAQQLGAALVASLLVGLLATWRAGRLERNLQRERAGAENTARELQRLSARLVTVEEDERRTIARELHDEVGQLLSAVKVELALARRTADSGAQGRLLASAESMTDEALHGVRDLSRLLHPALLDDLGLPAAVDWYLQGFGRRTGIRVELVQEGMDERLPPVAEAGAYRIIQEALSNVARHARASLCRVYVQRRVGSVAITVEDNGIGFDPAVPPAGLAPGGLGLIGIRERAWQLGGTVRLETAPGTGTRLTVELPAPGGGPAATPSPALALSLASAPLTQPLAPMSGPATHQT